MTKIKLTPRQVYFQIIYNQMLEDNPSTLGHVKYITEEADENFVRDVYVEMSLDKSRMISEIKKLENVEHIKGFKRWLL